MRSDPETAWPTISIEELLLRGALVVNDGYRAKNAELGHTGLPFARAGNVRGGFDFSDADILQPGSVSKAGPKVSQPSDVVFTSKGTVGRFGFVRDDTPRFVYSPQLCFWRVLDRRFLDPRFLYFWMHGDECRHQFQALKGQTDMADYISLRDQRTIRLKLPPLTVQQRIARVLGALDDKIDSNRRLARLLEQIAETEFQARFVDFVGVEDLEDSELGPIPAGWRAGVLEELVTIEMGQSPPGASYVEDPDAGLPLVQGMGDFGNRYPRIGRFTTEPRKRAPAGAVLMTVRAPVGAVNLARHEVCIGRGVAALTSTSPAFAAFLVRNLEPRWASEESGTIFPAVNRKQIAGLPVVVPAEDAIGEFERFGRLVMDQLAVLHDETQALTGIRDALLPKLISGQIRVPATSDPGEVIGPLVDEAA